MIAMFNLPEVPEKPWPRDSIAELLARLDIIICSRGQIPGLGDTAKAQSHKQHTLKLLRESLSNDYSEEEIERKLYGLYKEGDRWPEYNFGRVFKFGSCEMRTIDEDMERNVSERFKNLQLITPRQSRSACRKSKLRASAETGNTSSIRKPTRTKLRHRESTTAQQVRHMTLKSQPSRKLAYSQIVGTVSTEPISPLEICTNISGSVCSDSDRHQLLRTEQNEAASRASLSLSRKKNELDNLAANDTAPELVSRLLYDQSLSELAYFRAKFRDLEADYQALERNDRQLSSVLAATNGISVEVQQVIKSKSNRIADLERQVRNQRLIHSFVSLDKSSNQIRNTRRLPGVFSELKSQIFSLSVLTGLEQLRKNPFHGQQLDLQKLSCTAFCVGQSSSSHQCTPPDYANYSPNTIVQSLTSAAIHDWIFHVDFQKSFHCIASMETPLLAEYRNAIATICGKEILGGLDFAAHHAVFKEKHFQDVFLPGAISRLTKRFIATLRPFIQVDSRVVTEELLEQKMDFIFGLAMEIKVLAITSQTTYECVWPTRGSNFADSHMLAEPLESSSHVDPEISSRHTLVELVLVPGLKAFRGERKDLDRIGFSMQKEQGSEFFDIITKAIVLI